MATEEKRSLHMICSQTPRETDGSSRGSGGEIRGLLEATEGFENPQGEWLSLSKTRKTGEGEGGI